MIDIVKFLGDFADRMSARTFMFLSAVEFFLATTELVTDQYLRVGAMLFVAGLLVIRAIYEDKNPPEVKTEPQN